MKGNFTFVAERAVANHSPILISKSPGRDEFSTHLTRAARDIARGLRGPLAGLLGDEIPRVECGYVEYLTGRELIDRVGPLAANCLFQQAEGGPRIMTSVGARAALSLTDRTFGGNGDVDDELPDQFPMSSELTLKRLEKAIGGAMRGILPMADGPDAICHRAEDLAAMSPFAEGDPSQMSCGVITLRVEEQGRDSWSILLAIMEEDLSTLFAGHPRLPAPRRRARSATDAPFADLPLPIAAHLAELTVPLARLSALKPGDVLPLSARREVPISIRGVTIALGAVGSQDGRVAIRITRKL
ncbi:flagellar motor switch protein FliM [uncultured Croceicoccus sp.]|uniref:FliM/FliN family flagellar motor switch protein n=1 Tax=uncultured Croceicoccus sp. TaxID=1295329 RepID=UPI002615F4AE|nr:flagellar motor switch protein FliM [uncultured Croceicoccus sp.]